MNDFLGGSGEPKQTQQPEQTTPANEQPFEAPAWLKGVPEELVKEPSVKNLPDLQSLVKSYVSAQKMIGAEKVVIPKKDATAEQWGEFYKKVGLPEAIDKYALTKDEKSPMEQAFFDSFKEAAFKNGILPHQAQGLLSAFDNIAKTNTEKFAAEAKAQAENNITALKTEWGEAFGSKLEIIKETVDKFGGDDLRAVLQNAGLATNPVVAKALLQIGENLQEKAPKGLESKTPGQVKSSIEEIMSDRNHPYHNPEHIGHAQAVREVEALFQKQYK